MKHIIHPTAGIRGYIPQVLRVVMFTVAGAAVAAGAVLVYGAYLVAKDERKAKAEGRDLYGR